MWSCLAWKKWYVATYCSLKYCSSLCCLELLGGAKINLLIEKATNRELYFLIREIRINIQENLITMSRFNKAELNDVRLDQTKKLLCE